MKQISTILSVVALGLTGVIYFTENREVVKLKKQVEGMKTTGKSNLKLPILI